MLSLDKHRASYIETFSSLETSQVDIQGKTQKIFWTQVRLILCVTSGPAKASIY